MHSWVAAAAGTTAIGLLYGGCAYAAMWPASQIFGRTLIAPAERDPAKHTVALTYDDGPSPRNTPALLDALAERNVQATFFLIGEHVCKYPDLARRVVAAGHVIGNHTAMHPNLARKSPVRVRDELTRCQATLQDMLGVTPVLFRPPYGGRRPDVLHTARSLGLTPVMWNVSGHDWEPIGAAGIAKHVAAGITRNHRQHVCSNILLHDASHLDGAELASREDTIIATRSLLGRGDLRFTTPLEWLHRGAWGIR
jgi:peptidoglycan/xylan/chitin deacetylase (PgdA/CDA1 family)